MQSMTKMEYIIEVEKWSKQYRWTIIIETNMTEYRTSDQIEQMFKSNR